MSVRDPVVVTTSGAMRYPSQDPEEVIWSHPVGIVTLPEPVVPFRFRVPEEENVNPEVVAQDTLSDPVVVTAPLKVSTVFTRLISYRHTSDTNVIAVFAGQFAHFKVSERFIWSSV